MRALLHGEHGQVTVGDVPDPAVVSPTDAVVRVLLAGVCGTDPRGLKGLPDIQPGPRAGHEFVGVVEDVGAEVRGLRRGDVVVAPFCWADGTCAPCREGLPTACADGGMWGGEHDGGQGEAVRVPFADATLLRLPVAPDDERLTAFLALADVLPTGEHAVRGARVAPGGTVAVVGDGPVGLCAVLAARRAGAERILLLGRHPARTAVGRAFGATHVVAERGPDAVARVRELTDGRGVHSAVDCADSGDAVATAFAAVRDGGAISLVGGTDAATCDLSQIFVRNLTVTGGITPARALMPALLDAVLKGDLDPSPLFDLTSSLDDAPAAYRAMADRSALKAVIRV